MRNDNISRQAAIDVVSRPICPTGDATYDNAREAERESIREELEQLTSANRRGEWIYVTIEEWLKTGRDYGHHCSECDEINESGKSNFCPNCGTDMRGSEG